MTSPYLTLLALAALLALCGAPRPFFNHYFPVTPMNLCSLSADRRVGADGTLLLRRGTAYHTGLLQWCSVVGLTPTQCALVENDVLDVLHAPERAEEHNWIGFPVVDRNRTTLLVRPQPAPLVLTPPTHSPLTPTLTLIFTLTRGRSSEWRSPWTCRTRAACGP